MRVRDTELCGALATYVMPESFKARLVVVWLLDEDKALDAHKHLRGSGRDARCNANI